MGDFGGWGVDDLQIQSPVADRIPTTPDATSHLDITSYVSQQRTIKPTPLRLTKPTTRAYGYRPPRLHELREERQRQKIVNPEAPHVDEFGVVHRGANKKLPVVTDSWDTRVAKRPIGSKSKDQSVFQPVARANNPRRSKVAPIPAPPKGQSLFDDEGPDGEDVCLPPTVENPTRVHNNVSNTNRLAECVFEETPAPAHHTPPNRSPSTHPPSELNSPSSPDATSNDDLGHLRESLRTTNLQIEGLEKQINDGVAARLNVQLQTRGAHADANSLASQIEKLRISVRIEERNLQQLFQKHRTSSKLITEIGHKDKLLREADKMLRAVNARLSKMDLKPAVESTNNNIPGKQRMRDAVHSRSALQTEIIRMKGSRDAYQAEIDKLFGKFFTHERILDQQSKALRTQQMKKSRTVEEKALADAQSEIDRAQAAFITQKAQREQTAEDEISDLKKVGERHTRLATKQTDEDDSKIVSQLMINVKLLQIEEEALRKQVNDKRNYLFSVREKEVQLSSHLSKINQEVNAHQLAQLTSSTPTGGATGVNSDGLVREGQEVRTSLEALRLKVVRISSDLEEEMGHSTNAAPTLKELAATHQLRVAELRDIKAKRAENEKKYAKEIEELKKGGQALDRSIEHVTSDISDQKERFMIATGHNTNVLEKLDVVERLLAMYNL